MFLPIAAAVLCVFECLQYLVLTFFYELVYYVVFAIKQYFHLHIQY